ncbi:hypothetical protein MRX96_007853 [Rhipicephalus microplus]
MGRRQRHVFQLAWQCGHSRIANKSEVGDACKRETWSNYAQVCPAKDTTFHNLGNTSVSWRNSTYMFTFENEGTLTKKVSHFLALHS